MTHEAFSFRPIGYVRSPYPDAASTPRQGSCESEGVIEILPEYEAGLADIDGFSHLHVIWVFHESRRSSLTALPPMSGKTRGVFATHSPNRPNPVALSLVRLVRREGNRLHVRDIDMADGTPVLDIKPFTRRMESMGEVRLGWLEDGT